MQLTRTLFGVVITIGVAMLMGQGAALAQNPPPTAAPGVFSLTNSYIQFVLGESGQLTDSAKNTYDVAGRFGVAAAKGDPEITTDDGLALMEMASIGNVWYPVFNSLRVRVGAATQVVGTNGSWTKTPQVYSQPAAGQQKGVTGPYMDAEWTTTGNVAVGIVAHLVRDTVRMQITVTNKAAAAQSVGLAMFTVPTPGTTPGMGFPFVPGFGQVLASGSGPQYYGRILSGLNIPDFLEMFDNVMDPTVAVRYTLRYQDSTVPDYLAIGNFDDLQLPAVQLPAGYTPDPMTPIDNLSTLMEWTQRTLAPGASRTFITYYGPAAASSAWTHRSGTKVTRDHAMLAAQGPRALKYDTDTGAGLTPDTFTIKAYIYNLDTDPGPYDLQDVSAFLFLPKGLELDPTSDAQQQVGPVSINSEAAPVEWTVHATGDYVGELQYYVSARDTSGWQQIVSRKIMVPAVKHMTATGGFQMVSIPFTANEPYLDHMFGWSGGSFFAKYYDPSVGSYQAVTSVQPGKGFWMAYNGLLTGQTMPVQLAGDAQIAGEVGGHQLGVIQLPLGQGWNMIGDPYVYPIYLGQLMVYSSTTDTTVGFDDAVAKNWISRTLFLWNSSKGAYEYVKTDDSQLLPWKGYWIRASVPVTLIFRPAAWPGGSVTTQVGGF